MASGRNFKEMLSAQWGRGKFLGVGLDSEFRKIPEMFRNASEGDAARVVVEFNTHIILQTRDVVSAYLANDKFYLALGAKGIAALKETIRRIHELAPAVPFVLGAYAGDVGHSNLATIDYTFDYLKADAITIYPYFGQDALQPLLDLEDKGIIVLCRTSNFGAGEFQDLVGREDDVPLYRSVAWRVSEYWNKQGNCSLLIGPMAHGELARVRNIVSHMPIFVTGIGTQSACGIIEEDDVREIVMNGRNSEAFGIVLCSSRGIIFSTDPHAEATRLHKLIEKYRFEKA